MSPCPTKYVWAWPIIGRIRKKKPFSSNLWSHGEITLFQILGQMLPNFHFQLLNCADYCQSETPVAVEMIIGLRIWVRFWRIHIFLPSRQKLIFVHAFHRFFAILPKIYYCPFHSSFCGISIEFNFCPSHSFLAIGQKIN